MIPQLQISVPLYIFSEILRESELFSLIDFMILLAHYLDDELDDQKFRYWAMDLVAITTLIRAHIETLSRNEKHMTGKSGDYSALLASVFFRKCPEPIERGIAFGISRISGNKDSMKVAAWIARAICIVNADLSEIGSSLLSLKTLFYEIGYVDQIYS